MARLSREQVGWDRARRDRRRTASRYGGPGCRVRVPVATPARIMRARPRGSLQVAHLKWTCTEHRRERQDPCRPIGGHVALVE